MLQQQPYILISISFNFSSYKTTSAHHRCSQPIALLSSPSSSHHGKLLEGKHLLSGHRMRTAPSTIARARRVLDRLTLVCPIPQWC